MKLLLSVRTLDEALAAAANGADLIDLKEPQAGALGALPLADIEAIAHRVRVVHPQLRLSATVGDDHAGHAALLQRVRETAACGIDDVKVGIGPQDAALLPQLAALAEMGLPARVQVVPVLLADRGVPLALIEQARALPFAALMLDTQDKSLGSLLAHCGASALRGFVTAVHVSGRLAGLAGSLRQADLPALHASGCDFAGFRSAVCSGDRRSALDPALVAGLHQARRELQTPTRGPVLA